MPIKKIMAAAALVASSTAAHAGYRDTWHGGTVGVDICYNMRGERFGKEQWKFAGVAIPCFSIY